MPLSIYTPKIDDRRFDDIKAEVRSRIARYTPEWNPVWTDVNDNDPGVILADLFAWMTDLLLYRMGNVPLLNYLKFLELIGIDLQPAEPATAEITFPVLPTASTEYVIVPAQTQVSAEGADGKPVIFETDRALNAIRAGLIAVLAYTGYDYSDLTGENTNPADGFQPFGPLATVGAAFLLGFDAVLPPINIDLTVYPANQSGPPAPVSCDLPVTPVYAPAKLDWEFWNGSAWQSLNLLKDETATLTRFGHVIFKLPNKAAIQPLQLSSIATPLYWVRASIVGGTYERPPQLFAVRTNTVGATQAQTVQDEVLGGSDGAPNQILRLENTPVLASTLRLEVDEGDGFQPWTEVPDFFGSKPLDRHYVLNRATGEVHFGNSFNGQIPVANPDNSGGNIVARRYRFGGGQRSNVSASTIKTVLTSIAGIDDVSVGNLQAAYGGRDEETLESARQRAPHALKSQCRAVTNEDFEVLATQSANVARARALPLAHPDFPGVQIPGVISVIVVPSAEPSNPMPTPSNGTLRTVCAYLNERRLLTTEVYVVAPEYQEIQVQVQVTAADDADLGEVKSDVEQSLLDYFHALRGGEDGQGWPFGGDIRYSRVYQRVFSVPGVQSIERLVITLDGEEAPECRDVPVPAAVLLYSGVHEVTVNYATGE